MNYLALINRALDSWMSVWENLDQGLHISSRLLFALAGNSKKTGCELHQDMTSLQQDVLGALWDVVRLLHISFGFRKFLNNSSRKIVNKNATCFFYNFSRKLNNHFQGIRESKCLPNHIPEMFRAKIGI